MNLIKIYIVCLALLQGISLWGQFEGGAGSGYDSLKMGNLDCQPIFMGSAASGHSSAAVASAQNCIFYLGGQNSGQDANMVASAQNCLFFKGDEGSGQSSSLFDNPFACPQFFASANGGDGHATRKFTDDNGSCFIIALPIEASPLFGEVIDAKGYLHWQTFSEIDNEGFEIQKSTDAIHWTNIGWVAAAGQSTQTLAYEFWDENLSAEWQYYRFRQVDYDGQEFYSNVISLHQQLAEEVSDIFTIYPNPIQTERNLQLRGWLQQDWDLQLRVVDALGRSLFRQVHHFQKGVDLVEIPVDFPAGTYWLILESAEKGMRQTIPFTVFE